MLHAPLTKTLRFAMLLLLTWPAGCDSSGIGDPCVPEDEYRSNFSGFSAKEVNIESRSFQCESRLCLVNHFQGRVSCPYGQASDDLSQASDAIQRCRVPGTNGSEPGDAIEVPVKPWLVARTPKDSVYCSCRCDGPDSHANYCECPSGYACQELVVNPKLEQRAQLAGSYCIKEGTQYHPTEQDCAATPSAPECPKPFGVNP